MRWYLVLRQEYEDLSALSRTYFFLSYMSAAYVMCRCVGVGLAPTKAEY